MTVEVNLCATCKGLLEGDEDSPCLNTTCLNSRRGRELRNSDERVPVDVAAALSATHRGLGPNRAQRRKATKAAKAGRSPRRKAGRPR